jgi:hypothetical protein
MSHSKTPLRRQLAATHPVPREVLVHTVARLVIISTVLLLLYSLLPLQDERWWIGAVIGLAAIGAILPLTLVRVQRIRTSDYPNLVAVEALLVLFSVLVIGFSAMYLTLDRNGSQFSGLETRVDAVYFTVTTLSTVGFGDVIAVGQTARVAVVIQIIVDFSLIAFGAKLVLGAARQRVNDRKASLLANLRMQPEVPPPMTATPPPTTDPTASPSD